MPQQQLHDLDAFRAGLARHDAVLLFKHSPICPVSAAAHREWTAFLGAHPAVPALFVDVIGDRAVARGIATECGVPHASPQAILFRGGSPVWNASHDAIRVGSLAAAWSASGGGDER